MAAEMEAGGVIGKETTIRGEVTGRADLRVEGKVEGTVRLEAELIVGEGGTVAAEVDTAAMTVEGRFDGKAACSDVVTLRPGSRSTGTLTAPRVVIEEDALFDGTLDMDVGLEAEAGGAHG
jgi:cytoskeletal protein CcmA (bactofilin family)